jgi:predicted PurR-regulated permease PerM
MTLRQRASFWLGAILVLLAALYLLGNILLPFVAGMAVAYFLDPVVDRMERVRVPRSLGTMLALLLFFCFFALLVILLVPLIHDQAIRLGERLPGYLDVLYERLTPLIAEVQRRLADSPDTGMSDIIGSSGAVLKWAAGVAGNLISGGAAIANLLSLILITPIVAFYLLRDWDRIVDRVDSWLPREQAPTIRDLARQIDETLSGFVRGQAMVCLLLGLFYAIGLTLVGLDFGLVIGLFAGVISFIPFVGSIVGGIASIGLALVQFDDMTWVIAVAAIFVIGQAIEGNFLTPNLVGDKVGLHPVWVMFALLAGGALFGFVGVLVAVPVAAVAGVMARFAIQQYLQSPLYEHRGRPASDRKPHTDDEVP